MSHIQSLADPSGSHAILAAVRWLETTLLGTVATTVAVIAVASIGLAMLTGRLDLRRGATVIAGCFVLFGATSIAAGIRTASSGFEVSSFEHAPSPAPAIMPREIQPPPPPEPPPPSQYDPYAGASVPAR